MIFYFFIFLTILILLVLQILFSLYIFFSNIVLEFLVISLIYFSLKYGSIFGEFYGFLSGILLDIFSVSIFGLRSLVLTILGFLLGKMSHKVDEDKIKVQLLLCFFVLSFYYLFIFLFCKIFFPESSCWMGFSVFLGRIGVNCFFTPFTFKLLDLLTKRIKKWSGKANYR